MHDRLCEKIGSSIGPALTIAGWRGATSGCDPRTTNAASGSLTSPKAASTGALTAAPEAAATSLDGASGDAAAKATPGDAKAAASKAPTAHAPETAHALAAKAT